MTHRAGHHDRFAARKPRAVSASGGRVNPRGPGERRAYSLLELITVLAVVATLGSIAAPRYANALSNYRSDAAARRIAADLRLASRHARVTSQDVTFDLNRSSDRYLIIGMPHPDDRSASYVVTLGSAPYHADLIAAPDKIIFDIYGRPDVGGEIRVRIGDLHERAVVIDGDTGEVTIR